MMLENDRPPLSAQPPHPWLVILHGQNMQKQTFFSISENQSYERRIPELRNKIIRAYAHEWLVLEDIDSTDCYLWNPISNDKVQLPPLPYSDRLECRLSAPPHDPECRVLFLINETTPPHDDTDDENPPDDTDDENSHDDTDDENSDDDTDDEYLYDDTDDENPDDDTDNESSDDEKDKESPDDDTDDENPDDDTDDENSDDDTDDENPDDDTVMNLRTLYFCKPGYNQEFHKQDLKSIIGDNRFTEWTVFKGKFYVLKFQSKILVRLDPDDDLGIITVTPMTNQPPYDHEIREFKGMPHSRSYLIQSSCDDDAELLYVHILYSGKEHQHAYNFLVFRFDFVKKVWEEVKSIGEAAIFLGACFGGTSCSTRGTNLNRDSIYFTEGRYLYIFSMETKSISVSLPCPHVGKTNPPSYWLTLPSQCRKH